MMPQQSIDPHIEMVVAMGSNGVIGRVGAMPWHLSTDLKRFKAITMGHPVVMGRKTFDSVGKALPGRINIVVTRSSGFSAPDTLVAGSLPEALDLARRRAEADSGCVFVIGGGEIYAQALPIADRLHVTHVDAAPDGDTYFPQIDPAVWEVEDTLDCAAGPKDSFATRYAVYRRRQPADH